MDLDQVSVKKDGAGIGMTLVPASSVISSGEHEVGGEVRKTPTASTANTLKCKKDPLNRLFLRVRTRSVSPVAVDKAVSARDSHEEYRPHESPANGRNTSGAVAAGGILLAPLGESSSSDRSFEPQPSAHKIVLNVDVAEEWVLDEKNLTIGRPTAGTDDSSEGCRRTPIRVVIG
jgi:hypothetical protein